MFFEERPTDLGNFRRAISSRERDFIEKPASFLEFIRESIEQELKIYPFYYIYFFEIYIKQFEGMMRRNKPHQALALLTELERLKLSVAKDFKEEKHSSKEEKDMVSPDISSEQIAASKVSLINFKAEMIHFRPKSFNDEALESRYNTFWEAITFAVEKIQAYQKSSDALMEEFAVSPVSLSEKLVRYERLTKTHLLSLLSSQSLSTLPLPLGANGSSSLSTPTQTPNNQQRPSTSKVTPFTPDDEGSETDNSANSSPSGCFGCL